MSFPVTDYRLRNEEMMTFDDGLPCPDGMQQSETDSFDNMAEKVALRRYSSTKLYPSCSCSSIDLDWNFMWTVDDQNAKLERNLIKDNRSKPRKPDDSYVCFKKWNHPGTVQWRNVVKSMASNTEEFPEWREEIYELMRIQLHANFGIRQFLVCCDDNGEPSKRTNNRWYLAAAKEIMERTKQRFADERKAQSKENQITSIISVSCVKRGRPCKRQKLDSPDSRTVSGESAESTSHVGEVVTLINLDEVLATFRKAAEQGLTTEMFESDTVSSTLFDNIQWLNQFMQCER